MSTLQKFFLAVLPQSWGESMRADSQRWQFRCCTCGWTRSVWDAGGIRWKAHSAGKRTMMRCLQCKQIRVAALEKKDQPLKP